MSTVTCDWGSQHSTLHCLLPGGDRQGHLPSFPGKTCRFCPSLWQRVLGYLEFPGLTLALSEISLLCPWVSIWSQCSLALAKSSRRSTNGTASVQPQTSSPTTRRRCPCINYVLTGLKCSAPLHHISLVDPWVQKEFVDVCKKSGWESIKIIIKGAAPHAVSLQAIHCSLPSECEQSA